jgi:hypothetical protein
MDPFIRYFAIAVCVAWPVLSFAQNQPTPSREDAERNAFQTPTTGKSGGAGPGDARDNHPLSGGQGPSTNPEAKNITEPTGSPTKASPNSPDK